MISEDPLPITVLFSLYWIILQFIYENQWYYQILCIEKPHPATKHIVLFTWSNWLYTLRGDMHSFLGMHPEKKAMGFSRILSQRQWIPCSSCHNIVCFSPSELYLGSRWLRQRVRRGHLLCEGGLCETWEGLLVCVE